jgi:O-glycosyl hydrolase
MAPVRFTSRCITRRSGALRGLFRLSRRGSVGALAILAAAAVSPYAAGAAASNEQTFQVSFGAQGFTASIPANSVATYVWHPGEQSVTPYITTPEGATSENGVLPQPPIALGSISGSLPTVNVTPGERRQEIDGFGGAMTESAAYVIQRSEDGTAILERLFSPPPAGAGFTIARVPIGPSDFNVAPTPTEYSLARDEEHLIPELKQASILAKGLKILATPWSAPGRMKIGRALVGSNVCEHSNDYLDKAKYQEYARYLTEAIADYQRQELPFWMLSLQNEPHNCNPAYPTMKMEPEDETSFSNLLYEELHSPESGLIDAPLKLLGWDHNWKDYNNEPANGECSLQSPTSYPRSLFQHENHIEALGFHGYCDGDPYAALSGVPTSIPFYETEATGFEKPYHPASSNLPFEVQKDLIDPLRAGAKGSLYWNVALDPDCGPQYGGRTCHGKKVEPYGCQFCRSLITVNADGSYRLNQDYYYWAQLSDFIRPGAHIIESSPTGDLDTIAAENTDGTITVTVLAGAKPQPPSWTTQRLPMPPGSTEDEILGVSCTTPSACTAVGWYREGSEPLQPLAEGWDGTAWSLENLSDPSVGALTDVSCTEATYCVVLANGGEGSQTSEVWNGAEWTSQPLDVPSSSSSFGLTDLSCASTSSFCEAVGFGRGEAFTPLAERWDSSSWRTQSAGSGNAELYGASCPSANWCMAVGWREPHTRRDASTAAETWDGTAWSLVPTPGTSSPHNNGLNTVSCSSASACLAVGSVTCPAKPLAERWANQQWSFIARPPLTCGVDDLSCANPNACLTVNSEQAAYWNGKTWAKEHTEPSAASVFAKPFAFRVTSRTVSCPAADYCVVGGPGELMYVRRR